MKQLHNLTQYHGDENESIIRDRYHCDIYEFSRLFEGKNIMPTVISDQRYSLEAMKNDIKWILSPDNVITFHGALSNSN